MDRILGDRADGTAPPAWQGPPFLGLVCVTRGDAVHFRTTTKRYLSSLATGAAREHLRGIYLDNVARLAGAVQFCRARGIRLYRVCSGLFPFADDDLGRDLLTAVEPGLREIGQRASAAGMRLVMHPDQYVVLSSDSDGVVENSVTILEHHGRVLDLLGQPRSPWAAVQIHGGKAGGAARLRRGVAALSPSARSRLVLENDERAYGAEELLAVCADLGVPLAFDAHHEVIWAGLSGFADPAIGRLTEAARATWPDPAWQIVHLSNGRDGVSDRRHADFVTDVPAAYLDVPWIEVEAKAKEDAIERLLGEGRLGR